MAEAPLCLAVDLGTGGPKVGLVTLRGEVLDSQVHSVATLRGDDGSATQDAAEWWNLIVASTRALLARHPEAPARVRAVAVTGQFASTVPVDAQGEPTGPCLTWLDGRGGRYVRERIGGPFVGYSARKVASFIRRSAGAPSPGGADPVGHMLFMLEEQAELVERSAYFMEPVDYLTMRFTGIASATHASRCAAWLTDVRDLDHLDYDAKLLGLVGIPREMLPPLLPFGSVVGPLSPTVANSLGLAEDVAVVTGIPDLHAAALASGTGLGDLHLALSSTSWISCPTAEKKTDVNHSIATVPGLGDGSYLVINNQETGAKALEWLQGVLAANGQKLSFEELTALAATSRPGANGVVFTPWLNGERSPVENRFLRASFSNLSMTTTSADLVRAVLEGVAANSRWLLTYVERFAAGASSEAIRLLGGGASSTLWCQVVADTLGRPVEQLPGPLTAQLGGAALGAAVALGELTLADVGVSRPKGQVFEPSVDAKATQERAELLPGIYRRDRRWKRGVKGVLS